MKKQNTNDILETLTEDLSNRLVDHNLLLFKAVQAENFEKATDIRNAITDEIRLSSELFALNGVPKNKCIEKFTQLSTYILTEITRKNGLIN